MYVLTLYSNLHETFVCNNVLVDMHVAHTVEVVSGQSSICPDCFRTPFLGIRLEQPSAPKFKGVSVMQEELIGKAMMTWLGVSSALLLQLPAENVFLLPFLSFSQLPSF